MPLGPGVKMIAGEEDIRSSLEILLSTQVGERVMQPTYGCDLRKLLFEPLDTSLLMSFIENMMRRELSIIGCFMSYSAPFPGHEWTETVDALLDGSLDMDTMISHRYALAEAPDVFAQIGAHTLTHRKIMLRPQGAS